jgi:prolyl-tRNA editing enzyme YbaK/EbsC (Cys-tRNA(Pro) deacylase)
VVELTNPALLRVVGAASRKGVTLDIKVFATSTQTAEEAAAALGVEVGQIVKSIVFVVPRPDGRLLPVVCLVSGKNQVDPSLLAACAGEASIRRATAREARDLTGFAIGGIPPIGHGKDVRIFMDQDLGPYQWVWAAAGTENSAFRVSPGTLRMLANAVVAPIAESPWATAARLAQIRPRVQLEARSGA